MQITHEGQSYEFPDDSTPAERNAFFRPPQAEKPAHKSTERLENILGTNRGPFEMIRDIAAGGARAAQNIGVMMGEGGQALGSLVSPLQEYVPNAMKIFPGVNIRNELGPERFNAGNAIQSAHPNPLLQGAAQFAPGLALGGTTFPGQVAGNALYATTQSAPDEKNAFGLLPSGRSGAAIEGGMMGGLPFALKSLHSLFANPSRTYNSLLQSTGRGKDLSQNIEELGSRIQYGNRIAKEEALTPKREVMEASGEERIIPEQKRGASLTHDVSNVFSENQNKFNEQQIRSMNMALRKYYKTGDIDELIETGEDVFGHAGLTEKEIDNLDQLLIPEKKVTGNYLKIKNPDEHYSDVLRDIHQEYVKNPTFRNSDKLRSRLFKRINELSKRREAKTITDAGEKALDSLIRNRKALISDQDNLIKTFSPENQEKYGKFNQIWREDVRAYEDANTTIKNIKNGHLKNITPDKITRAFSFPELNPQMQKVLNDIGPSGINNIVFNELGKASSPKQALKILDDLSFNKGFERYLTPEIKSYMQQLRSQIRNRNALLWGAGFTGSALGAGALYEAGKRALK